VTGCGEVVRATGGDAPLVGAFLCTTMVRCLTMGSGRAELCAADATSADGLEPRMPQSKETAAIPATNDAARPPAVTRADL
jgi:hypothetical protein